MKGRFQITGEDGRDKKYEKFISKIADLGLTIHFLDDDRSLVTAAVEDQISQEEIEIDGMVVYQSGQHQLRELEQKKRNTQLRLSLDRLRSWAQRRLIADFSRADASAPTMYGEILSRINEIASSNVPDEKNRESMLKRLSDLKVKAEPFVSLGLSSLVDSEAIEVHLRNAPLERLPLIENVLSPYFNSVKHRLDALEEVQSVLSNYVKSLNMFFVDKFVRFDINSGLRVFRSDEHETLISPESLSSGEKQLVLLFSNVLAARTSSSIFIIDEPELSLNVEWQRLLISALLDCIGHSNVQFVMATHSMEIISQHLDHVLQLETGR